MVVQIFEAVVNIGLKMLSAKYVKENILHGFIDKEQTLLNNEIKTSSNDFKHKICD